MAGAQLPALAWCLVPFDPQSVQGLVAGSATCLVAGIVFRWVGSEEGELYRREGVLVVVGAWLIASMAGAIPYLVSGAIPSFADALFESTSGFTTTGASTLTNVELLSPALLFWRSMTQWLGGIGIVVLFVALLSELGPGARILFKLEVPGPKAEIFHAHVHETAVALFKIYLLLTVSQTILMMVFGANLFDALTHTFSTVSTGGFSPYNASAGHFPPANQIVILIFMLGSGINFSLYYAIAKRRNFRALRDVELQVYLGITLLAVVLVSVDLLSAATSSASGSIALDAAFQVVSLMTTTGFATADFGRWPGMAQAILVGLMFAGGCAGSTAGGAKIIRILVAIKVAMREVMLTFSPNSVKAIVVGDQVVPEDSARAVVALVFLWVVGWGLGGLALSVGDVDVVTAMTASLATVSNIGPGLAGVGPTQNFAFFADWQKIVMIVLMWLGRLEFFAVLALIMPRFWRR